MDNSHNNNSGNALFSFLVGLSIGGVIAFLMNSENREKVREKYAETKIIMDEKKKQAAGKLKETVRNAHNKADDKLEDLDNYLEEQEKGTAKT